MPSVDVFSLPGFDYATGMLMLPWWVAAAVAAVLVVVIVVAMVRGGAASVVSGLGAIAGLALVVALAGVWVSRTAERERADDRRALAGRAQGLTMQATMPGSALACLDAVAGETVELACEKALFETPQAVSAAASYVASRIALLSDGVDYALRANSSYEAILPGVRRALEADRYGFVAHVLAVSYGCSPDHCEALVLFRDSARISANLKDKTFDGYVTRYAGASPERQSRSPVAATGGASPLPRGFEAPSAASIPPVSIMTPESPSAQPNSGAAPAEAAAAPPSPPRRPAPSRPARPGQATAPVQLVPPAPTTPPGNTGSAPRPQ